MCEFYDTQLNSTEQHWVLNIPQTSSFLLHSVFLGNSELINFHCNIKDRKVNAQRYIVDISCGIVGDSGSSGPIKWHHSLCWSSEKTKSSDIPWDILHIMWQYFDSVGSQNKEICNNNAIKTYSSHSYWISQYITMQPASIQLCQGRKSLSQNGCQNISKAEDTKRFSVWIHHE